MANLFCLVCSKSFPEAELSGHVTSVHFGFLPFACTSCDFTAAQEAEVLQHAEKEGHIPFVVDRSNAKPYLTSLSKQIVGHCKIFSVSKNFAGILAGLNSQIAADLSMLNGAKCEVRSGPVCDSEMSSERSMSTPQSTLASSLKTNVDAASCSIANGVCGLPEGPSHSVVTPNSNHSSEFLTTRNESTVMSLENSISYVLSETDQKESSLALSLCTLCASNEGFSADQREGHVLEHLTRNGMATASSSDNPAAYFSELAKMWRQCFPPSGLNADSNSASPERHVTTKTRGVEKKYATCLQCGKCLAKCTRRTGHVWQYHMNGLDRSVFEQQFELCFGYLPRPVGRPAEKSISSLTSVPAVSKPNIEASSGKLLNSSEPRYPFRRSLSAQKVDRADSSLTSTTPPRKGGGDSSKLSSFVTKFGVVRRYMRDTSTGRFGRVPAKILNRRPKRDSSTGSLPVLRVPDCETTGHVRALPQIPKGRPKKHVPPMACRLCNNQKPVGSQCRASHVWYNHMHGYKRLTCDVCGSKDNFQTKMQADCAVRHPDSKPIIRVLQSAETRRRYERQYLLCFGKLPSAAKGFFKSAKPNRPLTGGTTEKSSPSSNQKISLSSNQKSSLSSNQKSSLSSNQKSSLSSNQKSSLSSNQKMMPDTRNTSRATKYQTSNGGATQCQLCSYIYSGPKRSENIKRHALTKHFGGEPIYSCSKCGYGCNFTNRSNVIRHVRTVHQGDPSVRAIDRSRKLAGKIQQCFDSCFPELGRYWKQKMEHETIRLLSEATISPTFAAFEQPSTSGFAAVEGGSKNDDAEMEEEGELDSSDDDSEEEVSLAIVKQKQWREKGRCKRAAAPVKTEEFNDQ